MKRISSILLVAILVMLASPPAGAAPAPRIDSFSPTSACVGAQVKISGSGFNDVSRVTFNGVAASFDRRNANEVDARVPPGATSGPISVTTPEGTATSSSSFTVKTGCPAIASFSPTSGPVGTSVVITGSGFSGTTTVQFNGQSAQFTVNSNSQVTATVPQNATTGPITVVTPSGPATSSSNFTVTASVAPTIRSFSPTEGCPGLSVTIDGTNLSGATTVRFNGIQATFTIESSSRISAVVPIGATTGPVSVGSPNGTATSQSNFIVPTGCPSIAAFTPSSGSSGSSVVISGSNFLGTTAVRFNGVSATFVVNSPTQISAVVPPGATTGRIAVTNGSGTAISASDFVVVSGSSSPSIATLEPTHGCPGVRVTITGANFSGATSVRFNGIAAEYTIESSTRISAIVPTGASSGPVTVMTPTGVASSPNSFTVRNDCPTIAGFTPTTGPSGTTVLISGAHFVGTIAVKFNGRSATSYIVNSPNQITAIVPPDASTGRITVTTGIGTATSLSNFTVTFSTTPTVTSFNPVTGPVGTAVQITGTNFESTRAVQFNGVPTTSFTVNSPTRITAVVPPGALTGPISVVTGTGTGTSSTDFGVTPAGSPTITTFSPTSGSSGTNVTITGTNFTGATSVQFNGAGARFVVNSGSQITATVPPGATTGPIRVGNENGTARSANSFTVTSSGSPTISSFSPTSGPVGAQVVIRGTNLLETSQVAFDGLAAKFVVNSSSQVTATVPLEATDGPIAVVTPAGTATSADAFNVTQAGARHPRSISLALRGHLVARGSVSSLQIDCSRNVPVHIQKRRSGGWRTIARTFTGSTGTYRAELLNRSGRYRAKTPVVARDDSVTCAGSISPTRTYRR